VDVVDLRRSKSGVLASFLEASHCRIAHATINSGASKARNVIFKCLRNTLGQLSTAAGTFGCMETQVHANIVATQLEMISQVERLD
jgi:hypothetical protein